MKSIREIYKTGKGPSSSHTMGPERAANYFKNAHPQADGFRVILYGSLSKTGVGHGTDRVLREVLAPVPTEIVFSDEALPASAHPNTMDLIALKNGAEADRLRVESIGGGDIRIPGQTDSESEEVYVEHSFAEIADFCKWRYIQTLSDYVELNEGPEIWAFLLDVWQTMKQSIDEGLSKTGVLPGGLNVQRKAKYLYEQHPDDENPAMKEFQMIAAYAYAVAEQNADNGTIVTAPTCGACGVLPAVLKYAQVTKGFTDAQSLPWACHRRHHRQPDQDQRLHLRGGVRLSGGDRHRLLHGRGGTGGAVPPESGSGGVRRGGRHGAPSGSDLRPHLRSGADSLHRAQRRRRSPRHERLQFELFSHRLPEHQLRHGVPRHAGDRRQSGSPLPGNQRGRPCQAVQPAKEAII